MKKEADALKVDAATAAELDQWYHLARRAEWKKLPDVRADFPLADRIGHVLVFNIRHNRYRLIVRVTFPIQKLFVKALLTHKEYDRKEWMKWTR